MNKLQSAYHRIPIILLTLTVFLFILARPEPSAAVVCPTITLGPNFTQNGVVGNSYSLNFTASSGRSPYTFSKVSGTMPPGTILSSGGTLSGTLREAGSFTFRLRAVDADGCPGERSFTISVVCPTITVNPSSLPGASVGVPYSQSLSATGGDAPYTFSIAAGSLPPGMLLGSGGALGGTPNTTGNYNFTIRATDENGCSGTRAYTLSVNCPNIELAPTSLNNGKVGDLYLQTITASGGQSPYTYSLFIGSLPPGMAISSTGVLNGAPTMAGSYSFTLRARDENNCFGTKVYTIVIDPGCPSITITPFGLPDASTGIAYSRNLEATGGSGRYNFAIIANSLPPGLNLNASSGAITGTPTTTGTYSFQVRVTDSNGCTGTKAYTVVVNCGSITLNPATLPNGAVGAPYTQSLTASGTRPPYTFPLTSGQLPPGLSLNAFGVLAGTPTMAGTYNFSVRVSDGNTCFTDKSYTITVNCPTITINPATLPAGTVGTAYSQVFSATGGTAPYSFGTQISALPPGLTWNTNGTLSGTPTTVGSYSFIVRGNDANGCFGERGYTLVINPLACPTITINPPAILSGRVGQSYSWGFMASGGAPPYTYSLVAGTLPAGLSVTGVTITGTPTVAGSFPITIRATDSNGCTGEREYTLIVSCPTITINPTTLPGATVGTAYNQSITASGGTAPYAFSLTFGALPAGISLSSSGAFSGTPTTSGTYTFNLQVSDAYACLHVRTMAIVVSNSTCPTITLNPSFPLPTGRIATPYSQTITAAGGAAPYAFSLSTGSSLPSGLTLSASGLLSGTPTAGGNFSFTIVATDANGCLGSRLYQLFIAPCPIITVNPADPNLPAAAISTPYSQTFSATGGTAPYTFTLLGTPPIGLAFNSTTGVLSGSATQSGTFPFSVRATDANGCIGVRAYTLIVSATCPAITVAPTNPNLPPATVGVPYTQTFSATGGAAPYRVERFAGSYPSGLTLDFTTGILSGTPTAPGTFNFSITFKDAGQCPGERSYTLVINNPACPTITVNPTSLPGGTTGTVYSQNLTASGGAAPYVFSVSSGSLPTGLALAISGTLSGTPTAAGTFGFTVRTRDANGCTGEREYTIVIAAPACPTISLNPTNAALPAGTTGTTYTQAFTATGSTTSYSFTIVGGSLPGGLALNSNGDLTGTPTAAGAFNFMVRASDGNGCTGERAYSLVINPPACPTISLTPATLLSGTLGSTYNQVISASGGAAPYGFSLIAGSLPAGLALNSTTGAITGSPGSAGLANFTVRATDANGCMGERAYAIIIAANLLTSVSAASFAPNTTLAPESIIAGFGVNLSPGTQVSTTFPLPTELSGVSLKVRDSAGTERLAPLFFVSPMQVNYLMPAGTVDGPSIVSVLNGSNVAAEGGVEITRVSPGLFSADGAGRGLASAVAIRIKAGGAQSFEPTTRFDSTLNQYVAVPIDMSNPTDQVFLAFYGTGMKFRSALTAVNCTIGGVVSDVLYAGEVPGFAGYDQLNVRLSPSLIGRGEVDVVVTIDGKVANTLRVSIR
jgi:uncharacterized protein (TIGR03437 family)